MTISQNIYEKLKFNNFIINKDCAFRDTTVLIIRLLHFLVIGFFIISPFRDNLQILLIHFISVPFLYLHWVTNNDTCALTLAEKYLRNVDDNHSFIYNVIAPFYNLNRDSENIIKSG